MSRRRPTGTCSQPDCGRPIKVIGLCQTHSARHYAGKPLDAPIRTYGGAAGDAAAAIASNTDDCILWRHSTSPKGYARMRVDGANVQVHRHVLIAVTGVEDEVARHRCRNRHCINPRHLEWGSHADNSNDMRRDGTLLYGERAPGAKLTDTEADAIRLDQRTAREIADTYGVSRWTVYDIKSGRRRSHSSRALEGSTS